MAAPVNPAAPAAAQAIEDLEIDLLLEGVYRRFGHDFRGYLREPLRQRLHAAMQSEGVATMSALQERVMHDPQAAERLLRELAAHVSALFGEPPYYRVLREKLMPWLQATPAPKLWVAECVAIEEVCGLAILLAEAGLQDKVRIFATAASEALLQQARRATFPLENFAAYAANYRAGGGQGNLLKFGCERGSDFVFSEALLSNVVWAQHNLVSDASFNEFDFIACRHALPKFGFALRTRVLQLFHDSLPLLGMLALPSRMPQPLAQLSGRYRAVVPERGLYQRVV